MGDVTIHDTNSEFVFKWQSQVKKGTLAFILLNVLKTNEFYGYELMEQVKKITAIEIAEGTLYPLMNRLKKEGLVNSKWVEQESGIPRKYYKLTNMGIEALNEMIIYWQNLQLSIKKVTR